MNRTEQDELTAKCAECQQLRAALEAAERRVKELEAIKQAALVAYAWMDAWGWGGDAPDQAKSDWYAAYHGLRGALARETR